jgi:hypothetical protein
VAGQRGVGSTGSTGNAVGFPVGTVLAVFLPNMHRLRTKEPCSTNGPGYRSSARTAGNGVHAVAGLVDRHVAALAKDNHVGLERGTVAAHGAQRLILAAAAGWKAPAYTPRSRHAACQTQPLVARCPPPRPPEAPPSTRRDTRHSVVQRPRYRHMHTRLSGTSVWHVCRTHVCLARLSDTRLSGTPRQLTARRRHPGGLRARAGWRGWCHPH